jgi:hypothetical protein
MQKLEPIKPGRIYRIIQSGNGDEPLFFEEANKLHFHRLMLKHLLPVCEILHFDLRRDKIELILKFRDLTEIPEKFRTKLYQSLSNLFNGYAKSVNKRYNRKGSLFKRRFDRIEIF